MVDRFIYLRHSKVWTDQEDGTSKIDLPFSQHQAPHSWGFLFVGGWVDSNVVYKKVGVIIMKNYKLIIFVLLTCSLLANDKEMITSVIKDNWISISKGKSPNILSPNGAWIATSEGSFWQFDSPEDNRARIEESPNILNIKPHHINVEIFGSKKDVAYVVYYLAGTIERDDKIIVPNYRTRASTIFKKESGKWYQVGSHFSPMHSGSGVKFD